MIGHLTHSLLTLSCLAACMTAGQLSLADVTTGQQEWTTFEELAQKRFNIGDRILTTGKYVELQDKKVGLFHCPVQFVVSSPGLQREILSVGSLHDTVKIRAVYVGEKDQKRVFEVQEISPGPSCEVVILKELQMLEKRGLDATGLLLSLVQRIYQTEVRFKKPKLRALARQASSSALRIKESELGPSDIPGRLLQVQKIHEVFPDRQNTMELLAGLEKEFPRSKEIKRALIQLDCRKFRGRWMTYQEFKRLQGFERYQNRWVTRREKEFLETVSRHLRSNEPPILRRLMKKEYKLLSERGETAIGMSREEVYTALGFSERVYRRVIQRRSGKEITFDQWVYDDRFYYFLDELLIRQPQSNRTPRRK